MVFKFSLDRLPITLSSEAISLGSRPFHFFNAWCDHLELRLVVKEEWNRSSVNPCDF